MQIGCSVKMLKNEVKKKWRNGTVDWTEMIAVNWVYIRLHSEKISASDLFFHENLLYFYELWVYLTCLVQFWFKYDIQCSFSLIMTQVFRIFWEKTIAEYMIQEWINLCSKCEKNRPKMDPKYHLEMHWNAINTR